MAQRAGIATALFFTKAARWKRAQVKTDLAVPSGFTTNHLPVGITFLGLTYASCKGPASGNNIVNLLTTKGILMDGGITGKKAADRGGIHCKTVTDAALVLDAAKGFK